MKSIPDGERLEGVSPLTQETLDALFEAAPAPMAYLDRDFNFVRVNPSYATAKGKTPADFPGKHYFALYPDAENEALFRQARDTGEPCSSDAKPSTDPISPSREITHWDWTLTLLKNPMGVVTGLLLTLRNATERVRAIAAHLESRKMLQTVIDTIPLRVYWKDRESRYRGCNVQFAADAGMANVVDVIGKDDSQLAWPWRATSDAVADREIMDSATAKPAFDELVTTPDGRQIWLRQSRTPLFNAAGEIIGMLGFYDDITERKAAERQLRITQTAIDKSKSAFFWIGSKGEVLYVNDHACQSLGYTREELTGQNVWKFDPDFPREAWSPFWEEFKRKGVMNFETRHRRKDGSAFPVEITCNHIVFDGEEQGGFNFVQDITERKRAERDLQLTHAAINKSKTCFYWLSPQGQVIYVNDYACASLGYTRDELIGLYIWDFDPDFPREAQPLAWEALKKHGSTTIESRHRRKDGGTFPIEATTNYISFNDEEYTFTFVQDISERKATEEKIRSLAFFDPLTKLPNRRLLMDRLKHALAASARSRTYGAVLFIDLDNFKNLNDTKGHDVGDLLLLDVAERLKLTTREEDTAARLGGDEFVMMLPALSDNREYAASLASAVANRVLDVLHRPCLLRGHEHNTSCSIGISLFHGQHDQVEDLLSWADTAMYEAKKAGRNTFRFFDPAMQDVLETRARLESWMRQALPQQQFQLHYQLQMSDDLRPMGAEALIRWLHPEQGFISPAAFMSLAEETGLILPIGQWVAETAIAQIKAWEPSPLACGLTISINVSARQFRQPDFVDQVKATLEHYRIDPTQLKLELTESLVLHNVEDTIEKMHRLKVLGVSFSMDDFGTGYSSLSYLKRLPLDQLKIDQSFVRDIATDPSDAVIVQTIINMGWNLGLQVLAEGVETEEQLSLLRQYGCKAFQGYLFGRPMLAADLERSLAMTAGDDRSAHLGFHRTGNTSVCR
ncbi:MAG: EAL domain-containing protein [Candidatus Competibacteraceae bacterium]